MPKSLWVAPDLAQTALQKTHNQNIIITQNTHSNYPPENYSNMLPHKGPFQKETILFQPPSFKRYTVSFMGEGSKLSQTNSPTNYPQLELHKSQQNFKMCNLKLHKLPTKLHNFWNFTVPSLPHLERIKAAKW